MRNYKKYKTIMLISFIEILFFLIFLLNISINTYQEYTKLNPVFIEENHLMFITNNKTFKNIRKNKYLYHNGTKKKIKIVSVVKNIYKKDGSSYHQILIEIPGVKNDKNLNICLYNKKKKIISLFLDTWKED